MTLLLAGHETTANALAWTCYLLAQHPEVEARLQAELQTVLGGRSPTAADVARLPVHRASHHRVDARLSAGLRRWAADDPPLRDRRLRRARGTTFLMSQWVLHHDERDSSTLHTNSAPSAGPTGLAKRIPKFAYFPFSGGPRVCVGNSFAMLEAVLLAATIARRFRFELVAGHRVATWATVTLRPKDGIRLVCRAVEPAKSPVAESHTSPTR